MSDIHSHSHRLFTVQDLLSWSPPRNTHIIHEGILNIKNRMLIFGDEGTWKSMLAMHTAHTVSRGSRWLGFSTASCNVLRLQAELPMYMDRERTEKYCTGSKSIYTVQYGNSNKERLDELANLYSYPSNIVNRTEQFIHIDESSGWESLRQDIDNCILYLPPAPLLVILDPLFKMFNRNLNEETDLKPLLDRIDLIMEDTKHSLGMSFIIVHHTRKSITDREGVVVPMGSQDATGSRALLRWCDTILRIDPASGDKTSTKLDLTFTKHRSAEDVPPYLTIQWDRVTLHPRILSRRRPTIEDTDEIELRGSELLASLE